MPSPRLIVIDLLKTAKRGFLRFKISADYLNILISIVRINFVYSALIYSLLVPLFRRIRATFSQFELKLKFSPTSAKTFYFPIRLFYGRKCPPSAEFNISSELNWEECRRHDLLLSNKFKTAKRGFISLKIRQNRQIIDL